MQKLYKRSLNYLIPILLGIMLGFVINMNFIKIAKVNGQSMNPTLSNKELLLVNNFKIRQHKIDREQIVVFDSKDKENPLYIKRVIGLPNEHIVIKNGDVFINNKRLEQKYLPENTFTDGDIDLVIPADEYFVMGDNRENSRDSRIIGTINYSRLKGIVQFKLS